MFLWARVCETRPGDREVRPRGRDERQAQCYVALSMQRWTVVSSSTQEAASEQGRSAGQDCGLPAASKVWGGLDVKLKD